MSRGVVRHDEASNVGQARHVGRCGLVRRHEAGAARRRDGTSGRRCGLPGRGLACRVGYEQAGSVGAGAGRGLGLSARKRLGVQSRARTVGIVQVRRKVPACECLDCQPGCVLEWVIEDSRQVQARLRMSPGVGGSEAVRHVARSGAESLGGSARKGERRRGSSRRAGSPGTGLSACGRDWYGMSGWAGDDSSGPAVVAGRACRSARRGDGTGSRGSRDGMAGEELSGGLGMATDRRVGAGGGGMGREGQSAGGGMRRLAQSAGLSNARARPVGTGAAGAELGFVGVKRAGVAP